MIKKVLFYLLVFLPALFTLFLLAGREHFFLGSGLNFIGFPLLLMMLITAFIAFRIKSHAIIKVVLLFSCTLLILEGLQGKLKEHRLQINENNMVNKEITLISYNLYFRNKNPEVIISRIKKLQPDIIAFQEVTPSLDRLLRKSLSYPYIVSKPLIGTHGLAIYSKYPLVNIRYMNNSGGRPVAQFCQVVIDNKTLAISNAHLASPAGSVQSLEKFKKYYKRNYYQRKRQYKEVNRLFEEHYAASDSRIFLGDLNTMRIEPLYKAIRHEWVDSFKEKGKGPGASWPNNKHVPAPYITIDYILIRGNIRPLTSYMIKGSSDHLGILSKLKI